MRCVTCGKRLSPQMKECPYCGAMVPAPEGASAPAATGFDWKSVLTPTSAPPPFGGEATPRPAPPARNSPQPAESTEDVFAEDEEAGEPAAPIAPKWTQYIFPAIIVLWFAFRIFGPEIKRYLSGAPDEERDVPAESISILPELRRLVLCERVEQNQPVGARDKFSRSKDKLASVFTAWEGGQGAESIQFNWNPPRGPALTGARNVVRLPGTQRNFLVVGELPVGEFTEAGPWRVEVLVEDEVVASYEFTVEP